MTPDDLKRAVERISSGEGAYVFTKHVPGIRNEAHSIAEPLAALLDVLSLGDADWDCAACGHDMSEHAPYCALAHLVAAINGEGEQ